MDLLADLDARGLLHDSTDRAVLGERLAAGPAVLYCGFDPTADSLHVGSLIGLLVLRRFADAGHRPLALVGGATGMVGDPSGKSEERNLLDDDTLARNLAGIREQVERISGAAVVDNRDWTGELTLLDFLRDVGKHVTVNQMVAKESVRGRMESDAGISFTEFSYMLLQAHDYLWLAEHRDCELQVGGSDQWGNITVGIDLIRRKLARPAHGLTWPLLTRADGTKFGKSATGENVWLAAERTSPYRFFQFWMQTDDRDLPRFLHQLTLLRIEEVEAVLADHAGGRERREGQRRLAREVTTIVHGPAATAAAEAASAVLFGSPLDDVGEDVLASLVGEVPTTTIGRGRLVEGIGLVDLLAETGLVPSRSAARRAVAQGAAYVNNRRVGDEAAVVGESDLRFGRFLLLRQGKRSYHLVVAAA